MYDLQISKDHPNSHTRLCCGKNNGCLSCQPVNVDDAQNSLPFCISANVSCCKKMPLYIYQYVENEIYNTKIVL